MKRDSGKIPLPDGRVRRAQEAGLMGNGRQDAAQSKEPGSGGKPSASHRQDKGFLE